MVTLVHGGTDTESEVDSEAERVALVAARAEQAALRAKLAVLQRAPPAAPAPLVAAAPPPLAHVAAAPRDRACETEAEAYEALRSAARSTCAVTELRTCRGSALVGAWDFLYLPHWKLRRGARGARDGCGRVELKASRTGADGYVQFSCKEGTFFTKATACDMLIFAVHDARSRSRSAGGWWFAVVPYHTTPLDSPLGNVLAREHFRAKPKALCEGLYGLRFVRGKALAEELTAAHADLPATRTGPPTRRLPDRDARPSQIKT